MQPSPGRRKRFMTAAARIAKMGGDAVRAAGERGLTMRIRRTWQGVLATAAMLALAACGGGGPGAGGPGTAGTASPAATGTAAAGGPGARILRTAIPGDPVGLDPYLTADANTVAITWNLYDQLVTVDAQGNLQPDLATSWEASADGKTLTFHLRPGVKFADGHTLTSADVKASFQRMLDPATKDPDASDYRVITSVDTPDAATVVMHLSAYDAALLSDLALPFAAIEPAGVDAASLKDKPDGTGPYRLASWTPGQDLVLKANPDYWQPGLPHIPEVDLKVVPDPATQIADLLAGSIDLLPGLSGQQASQLKGQSGVVLAQAPSGNIQILAINDARPPFTDVRVRQALSLGIDRNAVVQGAWFGYATPVGTFLPPNSPYYAAQPTPYDPAKARQLLAEAGHPNGFASTLDLPSLYPVHVQTGQVIAAQLAQIGVNLKLNQVEWATWLSQDYGKRQYDLTIISHTGRLDPDTLLVRFTSTYPYDYENYRNPTYDSLIAQGRAARDPAQRKRIYAQAQQILATDVPAVFLDVSDNIAAMRQNVTGWQWLPLAVSQFAQVQMK
jgi:peptide/nickel transport system substrate-binding protein